MELGYETARAAMCSTEVCDSRRDGHLRRDARGDGERLQAKDTEPAARGCAMKNAMGETTHGIL